MYYKLLLHRYRIHLITSLLYISVSRHSSCQLMNRIKLEEKDGYMLMKSLFFFFFFFFVAAV